jgi:glutathione S-transferase
MMRLYCHPLSSNSRRVLLTARHLGLNLELVVVDLSSNEHKTPDFLHLKSEWKDSHLVDRGFQLWESHAIMQYLADKSPEQDIYPQDVSARADVNQIAGCFGRRIISLLPPALSFESGYRKD